MENLPGLKEALDSIAQTMDEKFTSFEDVLNQQDNAMTMDAIEMAVNNWFVDQEEKWFKETGEVLRSAGVFQRSDFSEAFLKSIESTDKMLDAVAEREAKRKNDPTHTKLSLGLDD